MKRFTSLLAVLALASTAATATPILGQTSNGASAPVNTAGYAYVGSGYSYGSQFVADKTNISGIGFYFSNPTQGGYWGVNSQAQFTFSLYDASLAQLASKSFTGAVGGWNDVFFNNVATTVGSKYYVLATSNFQQSAVLTYQSGKSANPGVYYSTGTQISLNSGVTLDSRIFANAATVPEPGSLLLFAIGMLALGGLTQRHRIGKR